MNANEKCILPLSGQIKKIHSMWINIYLIIIIFQYSCERLPFTKNLIKLKFMRKIQMPFIEFYWNNKVRNKETKSNWLLLVMNVLESLLALFKELSGKNKHLVNTLQIFYFLRTYNHCKHQLPIAMQS